MDWKMYACVADMNQWGAANMLKEETGNSKHLPLWEAWSENKEGQFPEGKVQDNTLG